MRISPPFVGSLFFFSLYFFTLSSVPRGESQKGAVGRKESLDSGVYFGCVSL